MLKKIRLLLNSKFNIDLLWNVAGFGISGIIGILINVLLYRFYDSSVLGVFNQIYADFFGDHKPTRTVVPVNPFYGGFLVEVDAVVFLGN